MSRRAARSLLVVSMPAALLACASSALPGARCTTDAECPASARCVRDACVANGRPVASISLPAAPITTGDVLVFDGSGSSDPDSGDSVASYAWTFRAVDAACAPPAVAGTGPAIQVRFACAGGYAVDLSVTDQMSARSEVETVGFLVAPHPGAPLLEAGPDVGVDHACSGTPFTCAPTSEVALSASAPGADGPVAFHWTAIPPAGLALDATRRVTFVPDDSAPAPKVLIETDGTAISGDWVFAVDASDGWGVLATAATRVSIRNRAPTVTATVPVLDHVYEVGQFSATGEIAISISDPDGDPIADRTPTWHHAGDGKGLFAGVDLGTKITVAVAVPYASPSDAAFLIGADGLERSVELVVHDVNGGEAREVWPVLVRNRPPVLVSSPAAVSVDHVFDPADPAYEATAALSVWVDPDGDPLVQSGSTGDAACGTIQLSGGEAVVSCTLGFSGYPALRNFAGPHVVTQRIADPWETGPATPVTVEIRDRPPRITGTTLDAGGCATTLGTCCLPAPFGMCGIYTSVAAPTTQTASFQIDDPDEDPLEIAVGTAGTVSPAGPPVCTEHECSVVLHAAQTEVCAQLVTQVPVTVSDGASSVSGSIDVGWRCL